MIINSSQSEEETLSFSMDDFAEALDKYDYKFNNGDIVKGKVFEYDSNGVLVDIGAKSFGFVPTGEASWESFTDVRKVLPLEEEFEFLIIKEQNADGQVTLSRRQLYIEQAWDNLTEIHENKKVVEMLVKSTNRGGVLGEVEGIRAFIPRSHLIEKDDLESLINQKLSANILTLDRNVRKLVLSQRDLARSEAISVLQEGVVVTGKVVKIQPYGFFVDLNGIAGLLHIKQISNALITSLNTVFQIGEEIKVVILEIDEMKQRISLCTKILEEYPGELLKNKQEVMENAEERLKRYKENKKQEQQKQKEAKKEKAPEEASNTEPQS